MNNYNFFSKTDAKLRIISEMAKDSTRKNMSFSEKSPQTESFFHKHAATTSGRYNVPPARVYIIMCRDRVHCR